MINGYYIVKDNPTIKIPLIPQKSLHLSGMNLIELVLPTCKEVYCWNNQLAELIIPPGCIVVDCCNNNLTKLIVPKSCKIIYCRFNKLPKIIVDLFRSQDPIKITLANNLQLR
jgi:hypothetical protein